MSGLAGRCWALHTAAEAGDAAAARRLEGLVARGPRAAQCATDLLYGWHRHPGQWDACEAQACPEATGPAAWAQSWEGYWPPGGAPPAG